MTCTDGYCYNLIEPVGFSLIGVSVAVCLALLYKYAIKKKWIRKPYFP